jgi:zinc-ribbon domain
MFCPRCGAENDEGSRYCASCGSELAKKAKAGGESAGAGASRGERISRLIGRDRRTRLVTLGTVAAIAVAIVAFLAIDTSGDEGPDLPQDTYTRAADSACIRHKKAIAEARSAALAGGGLAAVNRYADSIVPIAGEWRLELNRVTVPPDRRDLVDGLAAALLEVEIEAGTLARVARESASRQATMVAARVDAATANVEAAIDSLGLERCGQLVVGDGQLVSQ